MNSNDNDRLLNWAIRNGIKVEWNEDLETYIRVKDSYKIGQRKIAPSYETITQQDKYRTPQNIRVLLIKK